MAKTRTPTVASINPTYCLLNLNPTWEENGEWHHGYRQVSPLDQPPTKNWQFTTLRRVKEGFVMKVVSPVYSYGPAGTSVKQTTQTVRGIIAYNQKALADKYNQGDIKTRVADLEVIHLPKEFYADIEIYIVGSTLSLRVTNVREPSLKALEKLRLRLDANLILSLLTKDIRATVFKQTISWPAVKITLTKTLPKGDFWPIEKITLPTEADYDIQ